METLKKIEDRINKNYWNNTLGLARSAFAICTLLTLVFNENDVIYLINGQGQLIKKTSWDIFSLFGNVSLGKGISISILILVISGYYPRITAIMHFWVSYSFFKASYMIEGGDQISSILTCLLIPILLLDNRKNHWCSNEEKRSYYVNLIAYFTYLAIGLQIAVLYFHSSVGKYNTTEWYNGTAVYYWIDDSTFGANSYVKNFLDYIFKSPTWVVAFTWGTLIFEIILFASFFNKDQKVKKYIFLFGVLFHLGIVFLFGLISFFFAMFGALILYTLWERNLNEIFNVKSLISWLKPLEHQKVK
jgi:antimicrobial peptide system SdpB family protein